MNGQALKQKMFLIFSQTLPVADPAPVLWHCRHGRLVCRSGLSSKDKPALPKYN
jgi:hypothetical protein